MVFLALNGVIESLEPHAEYLKPLVVYGRFVTYPARMVVIIAVLIYYRRAYVEIRWRDMGRPLHTAVSILVGALVFILWIRLDHGWMSQGKTGGFDPTLLRGSILYPVTIGIRLFGATIVVPIIEELFWRSFLMRYLIRPTFLEIPIGSFSAFSFVATMILFGLEHDLWFAGMVAGIAYAGIAYYTKSIPQCILVHAVTNGILGIYVITGGHWQYW